MPVETHKAEFRWFVKVLGEEGWIDGQTVAVDATMLEANAAMRSIRRRDDGRGYEEYLKDLAKAEGLEEPTREQAARLDRKRKKKMSNKDWKSPTDADARIWRTRPSMRWICPAARWWRSRSKPPTWATPPPSELRYSKRRPTRRRSM